MVSDTAMVYNSLTCVHLYLHVTARKHQSLLVKEGGPCVRSDPGALFNLLLTLQNVFLYIYTVS